MISDFMQVVTTIDRREAADVLARAIVERKLAACVQIVGPIRSVYRWKGNIETAEEWMCIVKTTAVKFADLEREIKAHHSYETPEILATPVTAGNADYLAWLGASVRAD
jgi:periplasmic divalent cation tolerance protein